MKLKNKPIDRAAESALVEKLVQDPEWVRRAREKIARLLAPKSPQVKLQIAAGSDVVIDGEPPLAQRATA